MERHPLGVVASITPFNFPIMVPNWTIPNAIALGNCLILKPSELVPLSAGRIAELLREAGLPDGVLQRRARRTARRSRRSAIIPGIEAVSFVGSTEVAKIVYRRGTANLKRVLALGGAKNHLIVMPDADPEMAAATSSPSMSRLRGTALHGGVGDGRGLRDRSHRRRMVDAGARDGAGTRRRPGDLPRGEGAHHALHRRGRGGGREGAGGRRGMPRSPGHEGGYYVGPTSSTTCAPDMRIAQEEVFGPVLAIVRATRRGRGDRGRERVALRQRRLGVHGERRLGAPRRWSRPAPAWSA